MHYWAMQLSIYKRRVDCFEHAVIVAYVGRLFELTSVFAYDMNGSMLAVYVDSMWKTTI